VGGGAQRKRAGGGWGREGRREWGSLVSGKPLFQSRRDHCLDFFIRGGDEVGC